MSDVFRYINNSDKPVTGGTVTVKPWDQVILSEENKQLSALCPEKLVGLKNGILINIKTPQTVVEVQPKELHIT